MPEQGVGELDKAEVVEGGFVVAHEDCAAFAQCKERHLLQVCSGTLRR